MLAILIFCVLTAILIFHQVFTQGLYSSMIMAALCVAAALTALNYYEIAAAFLSNLGLAAWAPHTISLMAIFILSLLGLREITDRFLPGNMKFSMIIDRLGSFVFSLIAALTITGIIALGLQSAPVPAKILGFDRCGENMDNPELDKNLFPNADRFVLSLMEQASKYSLAGKNSFVHNHPDMLRGLYLNRLVPEKHQGTRHEAHPDAIRVINFWRVNTPLIDNNGKQIVEDPDKTYLGVNLNIKSGTNDRKNHGARDADGSVRFALGHIRLVGFDPTRSVTSGLSVYPIGFINSDSDRVEISPINTGKRYSGNVNVSLLFAWPNNIKDSPPRYIEFKRSARANVDSKKILANIK